MNKIIMSPLYVNEEGYLHQIDFLNIIIGIKSNGEDMYYQCIDIIKNVTVTRIFLGSLFPYHKAETIINLFNHYTKRGK